MAQLPARDVTFCALSFICLSATDLDSASNTEKFQRLIMSGSLGPTSPNADKRLRILVLTSTFPRYQGDHEPAFVSELGKRLSTHFDIEVLAPHAPGLATEEVLANQRVTRFRYAPESFERLAYDGGMLFRLRQKPLRYLLVPAFLIAQYLAAIRIIREQRIDVIHAHWLLPQGLVAALIKVTRPKAPPVLCTSHGADLFSLQGRLLLKMKKWIVHQCDHLAVVSHSMKKNLLELGISPEKVDVAPMGVDLSSRFVPDEARRKPNALVFAGRLVEKKGLTFLLEALPSVLNQHPRVNLIIAGTGPEETRLRAQAKNLNILEHIEFLGPVKNQELPSVFRSGSLAVFPFVVTSSGDQEGLGLVMIEALGCGCAVIASDLQAVKDVIIDGKTGKTVPPADPEELARAITELLDNPDLGNRLANEGRQWVLDRFDWSVATENYVEIFRSLGGGI